MSAAAGVGSKSSPFLSKLRELDEAQQGKKNPEHQNLTELFTNSLLQHQGNLAVQNPQKKEDDEEESKKDTINPKQLPWFHYCNSMADSNGLLLVRKVCAYGKRCLFAHSQEELILGRIKARIFFDPRYQANYCDYERVTSKIVVPGPCPYGIGCTYAHNLEEIEKSSVFRTTEDLMDPYRNSQLQAAKNQIRNVEFRRYPHPKSAVYNKK